LTTATVTFSDSILVYFNAIAGQDSLYTRRAGSDTFFGEGENILALTDSDQLNDSLHVNLPISFMDSVIDPANKLLSGLGPVSLEWDITTFAERFIMAAVLRDSAYTGYGFSTDQGIFDVQGTLPPEAFTLADGINPDTGLYNIYVYALTGYPDSAALSGILPVPLPHQFADTAYTENITGRFGTVRVALLDTLRVAVQN
jgi:hypothetical protein